MGVSKTQTLQGELHPQFGILSLDLRPCCTALVRISRYTTKEHAKKWLEKVSEMTDLVLVCEDEANNDLRAKVINDSVLHLSDKDLDNFFKKVTVRWPDVFPFTASLYY